MDWTRQIDSYCERLGPGFWAEPVNAVTNAAFLLAAFVMWRRSAGLAMGRALSIVLAAIGTGSFLFHTYAEVWAALADVIPVMVFVLLYLYAVNRDALGFGPWAAAGATALFFPYVGMMVPAFSLVPGLADSAAYAPIPLLIFLYAAFLRGRLPAFARGLAAGAALLVVSILFRTLDGPLCSGGIGTHFVWHLLNATMLGWMIEVYRRLRLGKVVVSG